MQPSPRVQSIATTSSGEASLRGGLRASFTWLALLALPIWLSSFAAFRPLAEPDEGRYTHIARWMTQSGDWLVPRIDGLPFLHKPPLYYWFEALVIEAFGLHLWTARLVSLMAALVICACVYHLVAVRKGTHAACWSVAVLATSPLFFGAAQFANLDMLVASFITLTLTLAVSATEVGPDRDRLLWLGAYAAAALGVMTKGLIGAVLPAAIFIIWAAVERRPDWIWRAVSLPGLVLFLAISLPWFLVMEREFSGFNHFFFIYHHVERFLTDEFNGHFGLWFYPVLVFCGVLPWSAAFAVLQFVRPMSYARILDSMKLAPLRRLAAIWLVFVIAFFSIPSSKMIGYILPILPGFAVIAGPIIARWQYRYPAFAVAAAICVVFGFVGPHWQKRTPAALADVIAAEIGPRDDVLIIDGFFYDVMVKLDRGRPLYVGGSWYHHSRELPDSLRRQLTEGREFDPAAGYVLIDDEGIARLTQHPRNNTWVIANSDVKNRYPWLAGIPVLAESGHKLLLKVQAE